MKNAIDITEYSIKYIFILTRIASLVASAPFFSHKIIPIKIKISLCLCIALIISTTIHIEKINQPLSIDALVLLAQQIMIGMTIGLIFQFIFQISLAGGYMIAMQTGLGFASFIDPTNQKSLPVITSIYLMTTMLVFLINNGHIHLMFIINKSFTLIPVKMNTPINLNFLDIVTYFGDIFHGGLLIAFPAIIGLIVANIVLSMMVKSSPQLSMFTIGFPIMLISGLVVIIINFSEMVSQIEHILLLGQQKTLQLIGNSNYG